MPLDESQKQKFRSWLDSKDARPTCASCGEKSWGAGEIVSLPILNSEGRVVKDFHAPMVQLVCANCGYTMLYSTVPIGMS
ncbi:MAG: hypothetical protein ACRDSJ_14190 [Rubrobacteraceae bacterium]